MLPGDNTLIQKDFSGNDNNAVECWVDGSCETNSNSYHALLIAQCTNTFENCQLVFDNVDVSIESAGKNKLKPATVAS